jgi:hypothetical protein
MSGVLAEMSSVGLAEIEERAALQSRVDRKYVMPIAEAGRLLEALAPVAAALEINGLRRFRYESMYFDTPDLASYRRTAYRHRRRFKIRTRTYVDSGTTWLEVKVPGPRGSTMKYRSPHEPGPFLNAGRVFIDDVFIRHDLAVQAGFAPTLRTRYLRVTLLLAPPTDSPGLGRDTAGDSRVTIDTGLHFNADHRDLHLPSTAIVETKTGSAASSADRLLWQWGHRPVAISKYATGLAAIRTDLPAAPWHRVLRRHFTTSMEDLGHV